MTLEFAPATKTGTKARVALEGPSGSGKTWTSLLLAKQLGSKIGVIDTEHGSASKYATDFQFQRLNLLPPFEPNRYVQALQAAARAGLDVVIIDSLSHEWDGPGGAREMVDKASERYGGNKWAAWNEVTPQHLRLIDSILRAPFHVIATMRSKMETEQQTNSQGRKEIVKLGMKAIQREGFEYEFDIVAALNTDHRIQVTKTRCHTLDGYTEDKPDMGEFGHRLRTWLADAEPLPAALVRAALDTVEIPETVKEQIVADVAAESPRTANRTGYADVALATAAAQQKVVDGKPLTEPELRIIEEGFKVARDKNRAKRDVLELVKGFGYVTWEQFVAHGAEHYGSAIALLQTHDLAKGAA